MYHNVVIISAYIMNIGRREYTHTHTHTHTSMQLFIYIFLIYTGLHNTASQGPESSARFLLWLALADIGGSDKDKVPGEKGGWVTM